MNKPTIHTPDDERKQAGPDLSRDAAILLLTYMVDTFGAERVQLWLNNLRTDARQHQALLLGGF